MFNPNLEPHLFDLLCKVILAELPSGDELEAAERAAKAYAAGLAVFGAARGAPVESVSSLASAGGTQSQGSDHPSGKTVFEDPKFGTRVVIPASPSPTHYRGDHSLESAIHELVKRFKDAGPDVHKAG